jgi:putative holliday junction resolvase
VKTRTRLLAIDPGKVRLGLAISDSERRLSSPLANYTRRTPELDARYLKQIIEEEEVAQIVVGLPVHLNGNEGEQAQKARAFGAWLQEISGILCVYFDERFTTSEAESSLWQAGLTHKKRKQRRDQVAAQILLQTYIEAGCPMQSESRPLDE